MLQLHALYSAIVSFVHHFRRLRHFSKYWQSCTNCSIDASLVPVRFTRRDFLPEQCLLPQMRRCRGAPRQSVPYAASRLAARLTFVAARQPSTMLYLRVAVFVLACWMIAGRCATLAAASKQPGLSTIVENWLRGEGGHSGETVSTAALEQPPTLVGYVMDRAQFRTPLHLGTRYLEGQLSSLDRFPVPQFQPAFEQVVAAMRRTLQANGLRLSRDDDLLGGSLHRSRHQESSERKVDVFRELFFREAPDTGRDVEGADGYIRYEVQQLCENDPPDKRAAEHATSVVHTDNYYPGAVYFIASDSAQFGTTVFSRHADEVGGVAEPFGIYQMDWTGFHSSKPFCAKSTSAVDAGRTSMFPSERWRPSAPEDPRTARTGRNKQAQFLASPHRPPRHPLRSRVSRGGCYASTRSRRRRQRVSLAQRAERRCLRPEARFQAGTQAVGDGVCVRTFFRVWFWHPVFAVLLYRLRPPHVMYLEKLPDTAPRCPFRAAQKCFASEAEVADPQFHHCHICCNGHRAIGDSVGCWKDREHDFDECCSAFASAPGVATAGTATELPMEVRGDLYWGYDYFLSSQKVASSGECAALCLDSGSLCGGYTHFQSSFAPQLPQEQHQAFSDGAGEQVVAVQFDGPSPAPNSILPVALILEMRGMCLLRGALPLAPASNFGGLPDVYLHVYRSRGLTSGHVLVGDDGSTTAPSEGVTTSRPAGGGPARGQPISRFETFEHCDLNSAILETHSFVHSVADCENLCRAAAACESYTYVTGSFDGDPWSGFSRQVYERLIQNRCVLKARTFTQTRTRRRNENNDEEGVGGQERGLVQNSHSFLPDNDFVQVSDTVSGPRPPPLRPVSVSDARPVDGDVRPHHCFHGDSWFAEFSPPVQLDRVELLFAQKSNGDDRSTEILVRANKYSISFAVATDGEINTQSRKSCGPPRSFSYSNVASKLPKEHCPELFSAPIARLELSGDVRLCQIELHGAAHVGPTLEAELLQPSAHLERLIRGRTSTGAQPHDPQELPPFPLCHEELIGRSSFFKLHSDSEQIRMAREDCELTSLGHYHYYDTHLLMNGKYSYNLAICFPRTYQDEDPLGESYCSLKDILKTYYRDAGAKCESLRILARERFWPHPHFGLTRTKMLGVGGSAGAEQTQTVGLGTPRLNFLIAGFARSGSTTVKANLQAGVLQKLGIGTSTKIIVGEDLLSFNWPALLRLADVKAFREVLAKPLQEQAARKQEATLLGFKSEAFAFSRHVDLVCKAFPHMKLIFVVREPIEWLQSVFNYRVHLRCAREGVGSPGCQDNVQHSFLEIARGDREFEDCGRRFGRYSEVLRNVFASCGRARVLVLEFEFLKQDATAFFRRIGRFLFDGTAGGGDWQKEGGARHAEQNLLVSRNEADKLSYNYVVKNVLCDDRALQSDYEEDAEIFRLLREYYADEYGRIGQILMEDQGFVSEKMQRGAQRSRAACQSFWAVNTNSSELAVSEKRSWEEEDTR